MVAVSKGIAKSLSKIFWGVIILSLWDISLIKTTWVEHHYRELVQKFSVIMILVKKLQAITF